MYKIICNHILILQSQINHWKGIEREECRMFRLLKTAPNRFLRIFAIILAITLTLSNASAQTENKQAEELLKQALSTSGAPGISAAVAVNGKIVFSQGVGYANLELQVPATGATVYRIASISKPISAIGVMQLIERGLVKLDDPIQKYVPSFPEKSEGKILLIHLLTHTSGLRHYKSGESVNMQYYNSLEEAIKIFKDDPLLFTPGSRYSYSTYGFNLLLGVIEAVGGRVSRGGELVSQEKIDFGEYMRQNVWLPAGMTSTFLEYHRVIVRNRADGYERNRQGQMQNAPYDEVSYKFAGGGVISTVEDMVRVCIALDSGILLKPETVKNMYTIHFSTGENRGRGLGWEVQKDSQGRLRISHSGSSTGFLSMLINYSDQKVVVAACSNCSFFSPGTLAQNIANIYLATKEPEPIK